MVPSHGTLRVYGGAAAAVGGAALFQHALRPLTGGQAGAFSFHLVILLVAWYAGRTPGLWTTLAAALCLNYLFLGRPSAWDWDPVNLLATLLFLVQGVLTSLFMGQLHASRAAAARDAQQLREKEVELAQHRRQLEASLHRTEASMAVLAHELRNHLSPMVLTLSLIERVGLSPERLARLHEITRRQTAHMQRLVEDLLDKHRVAKGQVRLEWRAVDLGELARTVAEDLQPRAQAAGVALCYPGPAAPVWVEGDATRLAQVMINLVQNATKFTDPGGRVTLWVHASPETDTAAIGVTDTGIGIEAAVLPWIFESYMQEEASIERSQKGLGLGLPLVRGLVELHGGSVQVKSDGRGKGAEFLCILPLSPREPRRVLRSLRAAQEVLS